jgi:large subunit ribosomal protein L10
MDRNQKKAFVADMNARFQEAGCVVVSHYRGLTVSQMETLRSNMRDVNADVKVGKNRLFKLAAKDTAYSNLADLFTGPSIMATSADPVAAAKAAQAFADKHDKFEILGGALGEKVLSVADIKALAKLPSLDELRATLIGLLQAPASKLAAVTQAPAGKVARVVAMKPETA